MAYCTGTGTCLKNNACVCICRNDTTLTMNTNCYCGHRKHNGFCPSNDCDFDCCPVMCWNYQFCQELVPQYILNENRGMSPHCAARYGRLHFMDLNANCSVCKKYTRMIQLDCKHVMCVGCWASEHTKKSYTCPWCPVTTP